MKLYHFILIVVSLILSDPAGGQENKYLEIGLSCGIIKASDKLSYNYNYGTFTISNKLEGTSSSAYLLFTPESIPLGFGYSVEIAQYGLSSSETDDEHIFLNNHHDQDFKLVSHGLIFRYSIMKKGILRPFVSLTPSYNYLRIRMDSLSFTFFPGNLPGDPIYPGSVKVTRPGHECSFGAFGFKPEIGINMILLEKIGFSLKTGYTFISQKHTDLAAEKQNFFSVHFGILYRFSDLKQQPE